METKEYATAMLHIETNQFCRWNGDRENIKHKTLEEAMLYGWEISKLLAMYTEYTLPIFLLVRTTEARQLEA